MKFEVRTRPHVIPSVARDRCAAGGTISVPPFPQIPRYARDDKHGVECEPRNCPNVAEENPKAEMKFEVRSVPPAPQIPRYARDDSTALNANLEIVRTWLKRIRKAEMSFEVRTRPHVIPSVARDRCAVGGTISVPSAPRCLATLGMTIVRSGIPRLSIRTSNFELRTFSERG